MIIRLIDHSEPARQVFRRGFLKGLSAPVMLFAANRAPVEVPELPPLPKVDVVRVPASLVQMTDLQRIGRDFSVVIGRYEQEVAQQSAITDQAR